MSRSLTAWAQTAEGLAVTVVAVVVIIEHVGPVMGRL